MKCLITPQQVIDLAFSASDQITATSIKPTKIDAAQEMYLRPALGALYDALLLDKYTAFASNYIMPALAYYVRYTIIPDLSLKLNDMGAQLFNGTHSNSATDKQRAEMRQQAKADANALLDKAIRYLAENNAEYPEYNPQENIRKKTSIGGGIIL